MELTAEFLERNYIKYEKDQKLIDHVRSNFKNIPSDMNQDNYERMISGMIYEPGEKTLEDTRLKTRDMVIDFASIKRRDFSTTEEYKKAKHDQLSKSLGNYGENSYCEPPVQFDYGFNTYIGDNFYSNFNLTLIDTGVVIIGNRVFCGPNVSLITATHPSDPTLRGAAIETTAPIKIEDNVWLCGNCTILPGVTVGEGSVIAAGAIVNKDIEKNSLVVGVPGRSIRKLDPENRGINVWELLKKNHFT